jgi:hypothetical protein
MPEKTIRMTRTQYQALSPKEKAEYEKALRAELVVCGDIKPAPEVEKVINVKVTPTGK